MSLIQSKDSTMELFVCFSFDYDLILLPAVQQEDARMVCLAVLAVAKMKFGRFGRYYYDWRVRDCTFRPARSTAIFPPQPY
jgi:hypothetical protein